MKRFLLLITCLIYSLWGMAQFSGSGSGTSNDPYKIYNPDQLSQVRNFLSTSGVCFKLMNNIDLGEWISENYPSQGWQPIGSSNAPFQGVFDGNGKIITNLSINRSGIYYVGFFGYTDGATIKDLTITGKTVKGGPYTGSLIGYGKSTTISNYTYSGNVTSSSYGGGVAGYISGGSVSTLTVTSTVTGTGSYMGGLFGVAGGQTITNASFTGAVSGTGYIGGAIGQVDNGTLTMTTCTVNAPVTGTSDYVGGIIGQSSNSISLSSCSQSGDITGKSYLGGIEGYASETTIFSNCNHTGDLNAGGSNIGGILGLNSNGSLSITTCNTTGEIKNGTNDVGGILGCTKGSSTLRNCKHFGNIVGTYNLGGIVGSVISCKITIEICHSDGNITGTANGCIGGVCGLMQNASSSSISTSSSWGDISGGTYLGGIVGYIKKTDAAGFSSIDFTAKIKPGEFTRKHRVKGKVKMVYKQNDAQPGYFQTQQYINDYLYNTYYFFDSDLTVSSDTLLSKVTSDKLYKSRKSYYKVTGGEDLSFHVEGFNQENYETKTFERIIQPSYQDTDYYLGSDSQSPIYPFYAGNGAFYKYLLNKSPQKTVTNIKNCSSVGNIISNTSGNFIGGIVGKDECDIGAYTEESNIYYYYQYDSNQLENVSIQYYNKTYQAKYPSLKSVALTTYTRTFDITNIEESYFSGSINGGNYVGGIAGFKVSGSVNRNYSNATITGFDYVGGLVGRLEKNSDDTNPTSFDANVAMNPRVFVTGSNAGRIYGSKDAYFSIAALGTNYENRVIATSTLYKNGIVRGVSDNLQNGTAVGVAQLRYKSNYVAWGWDFNKNWTILETESFPYKVWQTAPPTFNGKLRTGATSVSGKSVDGGTVTLITTDDNKKYTASAPNNTWSVTLNTGLHANEEVIAYAQKTGWQRSYMANTIAGLIGTGTPNDPYLIYSAYDLAGITKEGNYKLMNDIDLTSWINENSPTTGWVSVGVASVEDSLVFEGDGHKITGLWSKPTSLSDYAGLFSRIQGVNSVIRNLTLEDVNIEGGNNYTAGLIGRFYGSLYNCHITGSVKSVKEDAYVGMLAGTLDGMASNCSAEGNVSSVSGSRVGLLLGYSTGDITNCNVTGNVESTNSLSAGLLVGDFTASTTLIISDCTANGTVTGTAQWMGGLTGKSRSAIKNCSVNVTLTNNIIPGVEQYTGGICGRLTGVEIYQCEATGTIRGGKYAGGVTGYTSGTIQQSLSSATVSGLEYVGGIVGYTKSNISNCYSSSDITASQTTSTAYAGGLVGYLVNSTLTNSYATGDVISSGLAAGVVCYIDGENASVTNCVAVNNKVAANSESGYAMRVIGGYTNGAADPEQTCLAYKDMAVSINNVPQRVYDDPLHGTATTMEALNTQSTYTGLGWDFSSVWYMNATTGLPDYLWNMEKASQTVTINPEIASMVYGGETITLPAQTDQGLSITWTSSNTSVATISGNTIISKGVGNTTISYTQAGNDIYNALSGSFNFMVNKAPLTITAESKSRQVGFENPELTVSYSGFVNGDNENSLTVRPLVTTTANSGSPVGTYPIIASGAVSSNYEITYVDGTLTILEIQAINELSVGALSMSPGSEQTASVSLENESSIIMVEFYLQLPDGFEISMDEDGYYLADLNNSRNNRHQLEVSKSDDGIYHFLCYSSKNNAFNNNSGELISFTLACTDGVEAGTYKGWIKNIILSDENKHEINPENISFNIEVKNYTMGDVNGDTRINGLDIVEMVDKIMGRPSDTFIFAAGDFDGNGVINGMDLVEEVALVMSQTISGAKTRRAPEKISPDIASMTMSKNTDGAISVGVESADGYILSQFVLELSGGQQLTDITASDRNHIVAYQPIDGNRYMVICYSLRNATFADNSDILRVSCEGSGTVSLTGAMLVNADRKLLQAGAAVLIETTGIELVNGSFAKPSDIYSISGALVKKDATSVRGLGKGIYVVDGKTLIIK